MAFEQHIVDAVRRKKDAGVKNAEIAMSVGLTEDQVRGLCHTRGIKKTMSGRIDVSIGTRLMDVYQHEAAIRGMRFDRFMRKVLVTIAKDKLFTAILDDDGK